MIQVAIHLGMKRSTTLVECKPLSTRMHFSGAVPGHAVPVLHRVTKV